MKCSRHLKQVTEQKEYYKTEDTFLLCKTYTFSKEMHFFVND